MRKFFSNEEPDEQQDEEESEEESEPQQRYTEEREVKMLQPYEYTFHYKNGDVETQKVYGKKIVKDKHDNKMYFKCNPHEATGRRRLVVEYDRFVRNYNTLVREPIKKKLDEEKWVFEYKSVNRNIISSSVNFFREQKVCDVDED